jgi:hypothetical protein
MHHLRTLLLFCIALLSAVACGSTKPKQQIATGDDAAEAARQPPTPQESAPYYEAESAKPPPATAPEPFRGARNKSRSRSSGAQDSAEGALESDEMPAWRRPGLATRWGEERDSHIREVHFARGDSPAALMKVFYDDEGGIEAATGRDSRFTHAGVFPVAGGALTVSVVDSDGDPLPALMSGGNNFVIGDKGDRYQIRITNHTPSRFEVVASVDGLDVIDGQDGSWSKRGYIVNAWSTLDIEGFRDSAHSVRAFRFGDVEESYAVLRGKGRNVGVIGVALFAERGFDFPPYGEVQRRRQADPFPGRFAPPPRGW